MDDIVKQALAKWPNVPDCYGWLALDARGRWFLRDQATQACGFFPSSKGSLLQHEKLIDFIGRNYEVDARGCWYFQNGPQRVYVELEDTPVVWRVDEDGSVRTHTGRSVQPQRCLVDEQGHVYLVADGVLGLVHTQDVMRMAVLIEAGRWEPHEVCSAALEAQFRFVRSPQQLVADAPSAAA
ncbi:DUF2946 family protein [Comamonas terrigena]|uniref:DUF2946 family protein n=1 Tax=Comamonas terrigena TaxID=32013 RepID=UPI0028ACC134|nr:DUF2946 family protein [Comamonas terrigena]